MSSAKHPGQIEMVDEETGKRHAVAAASAPPEVAFVGGQAVVRIVKSRRGSEVLLRSFGADGALLSTTVGTTG